MQTEQLSPSPRDLTRAATILRDGGLVAFPTETVYGLGGDARDDRAVARIFDAKGRPRFNPLIVHVPSVEAARALARFDERAEQLAAAFWPGPLTLVLPLCPGAVIAPAVTAGLPTIALRCPAHPVMRAVLEASDLGRQQARQCPDFQPEAVVERFLGAMDAVINRVRKGS